MDGLNVVEIGESVRWNPLRFGFGFVLDIGENSDLPVPLHCFSCINFVVI
jgi:hypothetical protein